MESNEIKINNIGKKFGGDFSVFFIAVVYLLYFFFFNFLFYTPGDNFFYGFAHLILRAFLFSLISFSPFFFLLWLLLCFLFFFVLSPQFIDVVAP